LGAKTLEQSLQHAAVSLALDNSSFVNSTIRDSEKPGAGAGRL
jgi:hypothetical protein